MKQNYFRILPFALLLFIGQALAQARCRQQCGGRRRRRFKKYTMCDSTRTQEVCTMFYRRRQREGYTCGSCPPEPPARLQCPAAGETAVELEDYSELTSLRLPLHSEISASLCTLWLVAETGTQVPIARSYQGHPWEAYSGHYAGLRVDCRGDGCQTRLPVVKPKLRERYGSYRYVLRSYDHTLAAEDEHARFLEQTTFGPRSEDLENLPSSFAGWIQEQVDVPYSSHRRMFRRYLNHGYRLPSYQGVVSHACKQGTRYRSYAFRDKDRDQYVEVIDDEENDRKVLSINGQVRTFVEAVNMTCGDPSHNVFFQNGTSYKVCRTPQNKLGTDFRLWHEGRGCDNVYFDGVRTGVPIVQFDDITPPTNPMVVLDGRAMEVDTQYFADQIAQELYIVSDLDEDECADVPEVTGHPDYLVVGLFNGSYWLHDSRFTLVENTLENPRMDSLSPDVNATRDLQSDYDVQCSRVPMNFLNEEHCQISTTATSCGDTIAVSSGLFTLTRDTFEKLYDGGPRYVYAVAGLRQEGNIPYDPPCTPGMRSRWIPVDDCSSDIFIDEPTHDTLAHLLNKSFDENPYMLDLTFPALGYSCSVENSTVYNMKVMVEGQCWENVHMFHYQVFDFTQWVLRHPGGRAAIKQFADVSGNFTLTFPHWHEMTRWYDNFEANLVEVGRLGDEISVTGSTDLEVVFADLIVKDDVAGAVVVCGSLDEVANEPELFGSVKRGAFDATTRYWRTTSTTYLLMQREMIFIHFALNAPDQLRQRIAWILSQILVISNADVGGTEATERFVVYYDIFVRNAFGNYRDVLKEVAYSTMMATMLSYLGSQSTAYVWQRFQRVEYADENFAREVMQLFSIGLYQLDSSGTAQVDDRGNALITYTNDDIAEYARLWTGFQIASGRGNVETRSKGNNHIDPMVINHLTRDVLPKMGLDRQYVGDRVPLCRDLPEKHFLRKGAAYRLLGSFPSPNLLRQEGSWATDPEIRRLILSKESALYERICNKPDANATCTYPSKVVLDENLECTGAECDIESPRVLEVESGIYYEYTRIPCVEQAFFENPQLTRTRRWTFACADPRLSVGSLVCCSGSDNTGITWGSEEFDGEFMSLATAEARCSKKGLNVCTRPWGGSCSGCSRDDPRWTSQSCNVRAKINLEGRISIVHHSDAENIDADDMTPNVRADTKIYFRVDWNGPIDEFLDDYEAKCEEIGCTRDSYDNLCLCPTSVTNTAAFTSTPSRKEILSTLKIGAFPPDLMEGAGLSRRRSTGDVRVYTQGRSQLSADTVFEVVDENGIARYFKNELSVVSVGEGGSLDLSFRNPPHFMSLTFPERRDAQYETEAGLDHYFYHKNTGPFLAVRFAQRFGLSNPSPRLISVASGAFRSGKYLDERTGHVLGSGEYGDLLALVSAILLDRESREVVLDADPMHGSLLEPYLKVIRLMRSLNFHTDDDKPFVEMTTTVIDEIGQQAHRLPNVFSFFLPEYSPPGAVGNANLVCPECGQLTGPKSIGIMNGLYSLIKYGFDKANGGFGFGRGGNDNNRLVGDYRYATGMNTYMPDVSASASEVVGALATLLTAGRLDSEKRSKLEGIYLDVLNTTFSAQESIIFLEQLIVSTPEFHANALSRNTGSIIPPTPPSEAGDNPYKAIIYIFLSGGADSFNMLVPHTCTGTNEAGATILEQYNAERGDLAFTDSERTLIIDAEGQPCNQFALHDELTSLKELYDDEDLVFFANTGVVEEAGVGKSDYRHRTNVQLFAHNAMQRETRTVDPANAAPGTGVLGRLATTLISKGYKTSSVTIDNPSVAVTPESGRQPDPLIISRSGIFPFDTKHSRETLTPRDHVDDLNAEPEEYSSLFGQTWSKQLVTGIRQADEMKGILDNTTLGEHWPSSLPTHGRRFSMVSRLIQSRAARGIERDFFYTGIGGWDHHSRLKDNLRPRLVQLNEGISWLTEELKRLEVWDDVAIVVTSEFARTITGNSGIGSDHGWGGHYFMIGGQVKGGRILGEYPQDITQDGPLNVGRGRVIPTTSWDAIWNGVAQRMGANTDEELDYCLPNRNGSTGDGFTDLMAEDDLFETDQ